MENFVMINERTGEELNPYDLSDFLKERSHKEKTIYVCKCSYPEKKLRYHFSSNRRLVPCQREFSSQHDESCSKNVEYQRRVSYANPLQKDEDGKLVARVYEDLFKRPNRNIIDKFVFLTWYPQKESDEELSIKLIECIEEIRKSAYVNI